MSWSQISSDFIQYQKDASGTSAVDYYLKCYAAGTSTPISVALGSSGTPLVDKVRLDSEGFAENESGGSTLVFVDQDYRLVLYINANDADNNNFANAFQDIDNIPVETSVSYDLPTAKDSGAVGDGVTDDSTAIQAADAANDSFRFSTGVYRIAASFTLTSNLVFDDDAVLLVDAGQTVTIAGTVTANPFSVIFAGNGDVVFDNTALDNRVYANWYAANGGSTTPNPDFAERWNEMWANAGLVTWVGMVGSYEFQGPINTTGWNNATIGTRTIDFGGAPQLIKHNGDIVLDTVDTSQAIYKNFECDTDSGFTPKAGLVRGRDSSDQGIGPCYFEHMKVRGSYSVSTMVAGSSERQTFVKFFLTNNYQNGSSEGSPCRIITNEPLGNFGIASTFKTVSTNPVLSGNGQHYIDCSCSNDNGSAPLPTPGANIGATTMVKYDGGHVFESDYQRSNGQASYSIDCSGGDAHGIEFRKLWIEPQVSSQQYTIFGIGDGSADGTISGLNIDVFSDSPQTESVYLKDVGRLWGLDFKGAWRQESSTTHGIIIESTGAVDMHGADIKAGFGSNVDLSGINSSSSDIGCTVHVRNMSNFIKPASANFNAIVISGVDGTKTYSEPAGFADGDTTPDITSGSYFFTANTGATTITALDGGDFGREVTVFIQDGNTTFDFTQPGLSGNGGVSYPASSGDMIRCSWYSGVWYCTISQA